MAGTNGNSSEAATAEVSPQQEHEQVRILLSEIGTTGLKEYFGFVTEAYNAALYWPTVAPLYSRLRTSCPEMVMIARAFTSWARSVVPILDLPDKPSDDDKKYADFILSDFDNMDGGFGEFLETVVERVPFDGWFWWDAVPSLRDPNWRPPDPEDTWRSEADDGLIGIRRMAPRDPNSFFQWEFNKKKRIRGMWQWDYPNDKVFLPLSHGLHMTFGDPHNPEGNSPLQAVWRLERIRYGLEVIQGIGFEHNAGFVSIEKTQPGTLSADDKITVKEAAKAILTAQEGNYALWPYGMVGKVIDVGFQAAPSLLDAIKNYSTLMLAVYMMQTIALNTLTNTGAQASQVDSTQLAVFTFNAMLDGFAQQYDDQIGKRMYAWNKDSFPGITTRPKIKFSHVKNNIALAALGSFLQTIEGVLPLGDEDYHAIRVESQFLPENNPEIVKNHPGEPPPMSGIGQPGDQQPERNIPPTGEPDPARKE
jgi:hypothetical protein